MLSEGRVGQTIVADGATREIRLGRYGGQAVFDSHGRYYDCVSRGNVFTSQVVAAMTWGTALTATAVTYTLHNPPNSGRNLVLLEATATIITNTTAGSVVYAVNDTPGQAIPATTTAATIRNCLLGAGNASIARVFSIATLPAAPVTVRSFFCVPATAVTALSPTMLIDDLAGKIILTPNTSITLQGITIVGTGFASMMWEEVIP